MVNKDEYILNSVDYAVARCLRSVGLSVTRRYSTLTLFFTSAAPPS